MLALFTVASFAQIANPRIARTTWNKELAYIQGGTMTFTYKTLTAPTITSPVISGTSTDAATHNNTGLWNWASDGDTIKINLYKGQYVFDLEIGNARKASIDSAGAAYFAGTLNSVGLATFDAGAKIGSASTHYIARMDSVKFGTQNKARWYKLTLNTGLSLFVAAYQAADTSGKY